MKSILFSILSSMLVVFTFTSNTEAFMTTQPATKTISTIRPNVATTRTISSSSSSTNLSMSRQWNFNEGRSPFGLKKNAEIWNGRVAQVGFTIVLLQELITGKGVVQGLQEGNFLNIAFLGVTVVSVVGLSAFLAIKGKDKFIDLDE